LALALSPAPTRAQCTISEIRTDTQKTITLENSTVRMTVDALHGGKVTSFLYKPLNREWLVSGQALFIDHVWQQIWPGELYDAPYEYTIVERGPQRVAVKVSRSLKAESNPTLSAIMVERTMTLTADSPAVQVDVSLTNPTTDIKTAGYWAQHIFRLGGLSNNYDFRPFTGGRAVATYEIKGDVGQDAGQDFVKDPTAGWTAVVNSVTGETAVFLMDYNDLRWLYNCIGNYTTEWYYDLLRMAPGRVWKTQYELLPLTGYHGVSYASRRLVADVRTVRGATGDRLVYTLGAGERPLTGVTLTASLRMMAAGAKPASETITVGDVGYQPAEIVSGLALPPGETPFTVEVTLQGGGATEHFTRYIAAPDRGGKLVAGVFKSDYSVKPPAKAKVLEMPANLTKTPHEGTAVVEVRGQYYPSWRLPEALQVLGPNTLQGANFTSNVYGEQLDYFPPGLKEAMALDVIVLNNAPAGSLGPEGEALLKEYVKNGGSLLVLGGWYAFGGGNYNDSVLAEMLPVTSGKPFDIKWYKEGLALKAGAGAGALPGLSLGSGMQVQWMQEAPTVKPGAQVVLTAGDKPFLVTGSYGQGRVACLLGTTAGVATPGSQLFCDSPEWPKMFSRIINWLKTGK
jgi:hypothetical protein